MRTALTTWLGKATRRVAQLRGGGSALPGLVVEKVDRGYMARQLATLPRGVVVVSGTNGKTTTTKLVSELFEALGVSVFTNRTGSNFTRGVVAALVAEASPTGRLDAEIAVLELDEAHAVHFVRDVPPNATLVLNVFRDQLDRFGEIDHTARLLGVVVSRTTDIVVLNRDDALVSALAAEAPSGTSVQWFGVDPALRARFPSDDALLGGSGPSSAGALPEPAPAIAELVAVEAPTVTIRLRGVDHSVPVRLTGLYNALNAAAALALVAELVPEASDEALFAALSTVEPAFGRGEQIVIDGVATELVLVKNPAGFRLALASFDPAGTTTAIAINDADADGRDMSWLWDVDFATLAPDGVAVVSGVRGTDMALRLDHDEVPIAQVIAELPEALDALLETARSADTPARIYCTYTAMLQLRRIIEQRAELTEVW